MKTDTPAVVFNEIFNHLEMVFNSQC